MIIEYWFLFNKELIYTNHRSLLAYPWCSAIVTEFKIHLATAQRRYWNCYYYVHIETMNRLEFQNLNGDMNKVKL